MNDLIKDIFDYHHHFNQKVIDQLLEIHAKLPARSLPLFSHLLNAHQIWNARITDTTPFGVHQEHSIEAFKKIDHNNYSNTLHILKNFDLKTTIHYSNSKGVGYSNTIQDILFHIANHTTHHRGQLVSDIRQSGFDPIATDYIFYKRILE